MPHSTFNSPYYLESAVLEIAIIRKLALTSIRYIPQYRIDIIKQFLNNVEFTIANQEYLLAEFLDSKYDDIPVEELTIQLKTRLDTCEHKRWLYIFTAFFLAFMDDVSDDEKMKQADILISVSNIFEVDEGFMEKVISGEFVDENTGDISEGIEWAK